MTALASLNIFDLRPRLSVKPISPTLDNIRRPRRGPVKGAVIHYNGPALSYRANTLAVLNHIINVDTPNHQSRIGGDSLMYHFCVLDNGDIYQTRDINFPAWHAAHPEANEYYIAIHLPLGEGQDATPRQWASVEALLAALRADHGFGRDKVRGHQEFSKTACPGLLQARVIAYRATSDAAPVGLTPQAAPRISIEQFRRVLSKYQSPATSVSEELYKVAVEEGIDPAVALAFFVHESSAGTKGLTATNDLRNWGNVRTPEVAGAGVVIQIPGRGGFVMYRTWQDGLRDWCKRIKGPKYAGAGLLTVEAITPKYAPSSDANNPARYAQAVREMVASWADVPAEQPTPAPKPTTRWRCINKANVNVRQQPRLHDALGREVPISKVVKYDDVIEVGAVKIDGDVETIRGDNRWLWLASGEGFAWAGNFKQES